MWDEETTRRTCVMAQSLGKLGSADAVPALLAALQHPDNLDLRICSAEALADIGDAQAAPVLLARAQSSSLAGDDVVAAIIALGDLGAPAAAGGLREIAKTNKDSRLRQLASVALRKVELLQSPDPVGELLRVLGTGTDGISDEWIIGRLAQQWEERVVPPLNEYVARKPGPSKTAIDAAALLLCHDALSDESVKTLASQENRYGRWLAAYATTQAQKVWPAR